MKVKETHIEGLVIIEPDVFFDKRGFFLESYSRERMYNTGIETDFVQDNQSESTYGVLRGLHYQKSPYGQAKLVRVVIGKVLDVVVDLRRDSPSFGKHFSTILDETNMNQLFIPKGCAHGFLTLSERSVFAYKCDAYYSPDADTGIRFDDATLGIDWHLPTDELIISEKDKSLPNFDPANF